MRRSANRTNGAVSGRTSRPPVAAGRVPLNVPLDASAGAVVLLVGILRISLRRWVLRLVGLTRALLVLEFCDVMRQPVWR